MKNLKYILLIFLFTSCEYMQWSYEKQEVAMALCEDEPTELIAEFTSSQPWKGQEYFHYRINEDATLNCGFWFLEKPTFDAEHVELERWENLTSSNKVGNAQYIIIDIIDINSDSSEFVLNQIRETFEGVYNGNVVCNGGDIEDYRIYTHLFKCPEYAIIGDLFGLKKD